MNRVTITLSVLFALITASLASTVSAQEVIASGSSWDNVGQRTSGDWAVVQRDDTFFIEFGSSFNARNAPDLKIYLSTEDASTRNNRNATENAVFIAALKTSSGAQSYRLPEDIDPADFQSLIIYCKAFSKFWAAVNF